MTIPIEIALIPPASLAQKWCEGRRFQMALAGELNTAPATDYHEFYNQSWKPWSSRWLLDNGAWESETLDPIRLLEIANKCGATEIMAPDVLYDPVATLEKTMEFLLFYNGYYQQWSDRKSTVAAIAHGGDSPKETMHFLDEVSKLYPAIVKTIAISRTFAYKSGNPTGRFELALEIKRLYQDRFQIHLLGFNDQWPTELQHCASFPGLIRSCDTVAPFTYAYHGLSIQSVGKLVVPRPDDYFNLPAESFPQDLLARNIADLERWARSPLYEGRIA